MIELIQLYPWQSVCVALLTFPTIKYIILPVITTILRETGREAYWHWLDPMVKRTIGNYKRSAHGTGFNPCAPSLESEVGQLLHRVKCLESATQTAPKERGDD